MDEVVTIVYRNNIISKVTEFATKQVEDKMIKADADSPRPVAAAHGWGHMLVPFAMEDGGRIGAHGQVVLRTLAKYAVAKWKFPPRPLHSATPTTPVAVAMWIRRWQHRLSFWLHFTLSRQVLRYLAPSVVH